MRMESAVAGQPPLISLVVPVYNAGAWLDEAMASIRRQSFEAFEVLLVDDGSTDDSAQKCSRVCAEDARFRLLRQKNAGPAAARLTGIRAASGQYFSFMDADDRLAPEHLARLAAGAKAVDLGRESLAVSGLVILGGGVLDGRELVNSGQVGLVFLDGLRQFIAFPALFCRVPGGVQIGLDGVSHVVSIASNLTSLSVEDDLISAAAHRILHNFYPLVCAPLDVLIIR